MKIPTRLCSSLMLIAALVPLPNYAAQLLVYNNNDVGAGSLRQAVLNNNALGGGNEIIFSNIVTGVITLSSQLPLTNNVTITGPGQDVLRISGNNATRVMLVSNAVVSISGLSIVNGSDFTVGAIYQPSGTLIIDHCTIATNFSQSVGGIYSFSTLVISNSTITRNMSGGGGAPAAAAIAAGNAGVNHTFLNCAFSHNTGGLAPISLGGVVVLNTCTIYGNFGGLSGGISFGGGSMFVTNCTITANQVGGASGAPGIRVFSGTAIVRNTIVAGNTYFSGNGGDCLGAFTSGGFNLIGKVNGSTGFGALGDQTGTTNSPLNAQLGPLKNNGGPTWTVAPLVNSPVLDQGHSGAATTDQRGLPRPYDKPEVPNAPGGNGADIGAFEAGTVTLFVTSLNDNGPGTLRQAILDVTPPEVYTITFPNLSGTISLATGELSIDKDLTITGPGATQLAVSGLSSSRIFNVHGGRVGISGLTLRDARATGINGGADQDGFAERGGAIYNQGILTLTDCVITNCAVAGGTGGPTQDGFAGNGGRGSGGAIANVGTLSLTRCTLVGNSASGGDGGGVTGGGSPGSGGVAYGGSLYNAGTANVTNSTISGSQAIAGTGDGGSGTGAGGGIYNELVAVLVTSTVVSNMATGSAFDFGGGIYDNGLGFLIRNSTIAGNHAGYGGGLYASIMDMGNTILAANTATSASADGSGTVTSSDYNLVQFNSDLTFVGATTHNIIGQNPSLGPLQNNGGPTFTMALLSSSPAIDRGKNFGPATDQRGRPRPYDFPNRTNASGGDASDIGAFEATPPMLSIAAQGPNLLVSWSTNDPGYTLESKTTLNPATLWSTVPGTPAVVGSQFTVTNSAVGNNFYRLKQ